MQDYSPLLWVHLMHSCPFFLHSSFFIISKFYILFTRAAFEKYFQNNPYRIKHLNSIESGQTIQVSARTITSIRLKVDNKNKEQYFTRVASPAPTLTVTEFGENLENRTLNITKSAIPPTITITSTQGGKVTIPVNIDELGNWKFRALGPSINSDATLKIESSSGGTLTRKPTRLR